MIKRQHDITLTSPLGEPFIPMTTEFPSQRKERIDWFKLAAIDLHELNSSGCSIEILQDNLSHVTFCEANTEFDLQTKSGQKSLLKMFRLAQLLLQYMFISQEYMENQMHNLQAEMNVLLQKYEEVSC